MQAQEQQEQDQIGQQQNAKQQYIHSVNTEQSFRKAQAEQSRMDELDQMTEQIEQERSY
jgi:hypothetical protein